MKGSGGSLKQGWCRGLLFLCCARLVLRPSVLTVLDLDKWMSHVEVFLDLWVGDV